MRPFCVVVGFFVGAVVVGCVVGCHASAPTPPSPSSCGVDPASTLVVRKGTAPVVITSAHAGRVTPKGCRGADVVDLDRRHCEKFGEGVCESGPCQAAGIDKFSREIALALERGLTRCLKQAPAFVGTDVARAFVDVNRDAFDKGGLGCAMESEPTRLHWQAFHDAVDDAIVAASHEGAERVVVIDVHTFGGPKNDVTPKEVMLGAGTPFGETLPHWKQRDPHLDVVFGNDGLRARLLRALEPLSAKPLSDGTSRPAAVFPESLASTATPTTTTPTTNSPADPDAEPANALLKGRYILRRASGLTPVPAAARHRPVPAVDALQVEVTAGLREEPDVVGAALAEALCGSLLQPVPAGSLKSP
jgi:hypothetical protein